MAAPVDVPTTAPGRSARRRRRRGGVRRWDRGALGAMVAILAPAMIGLIGLVYDGGLALEGRQRVFDVAEQAARAGANACDPEAFYNGSRTCVLDPAAARTAVMAYSGDSDVTITSVTILNDQTVRVEATTTVNTIFLGMFGVNSFNLQGARQATAVTGTAG